MAKVFVLGLDGAPPRMVFGEWKKHLPNISEMMKEGCYARMKSSIPPSTIVAWSSFCSGYDAGQLGVYSYTHQLKKNSNKRMFTNSTCVKKPLIWDELSKKGLKSNVLNIPLTFPAKKINGIMITDFLTPSFESNSVYPLAFKKEMLKLFNGKKYMFDVGEFTAYKRMSTEKLLKKTYEMTEMHFKVMNHLIDNSKWDFFITEIIGTDRLGHLFWHYFDKKHVRYEKNSKFKNSMLDYFIWVDKEIGKLRRKLPKDGVLIIASDHGIERMDGKININDWLIKEGYLVLKKDYAELAVLKPQKLSLEGIDFTKTKAYSVGSYQGRIYINLKERDKQGIVSKKDFNKIRKELERKLKTIKGKTGRKLDTKVYWPEKIYSEYDWRCPDLTVYFDDLIYGSNDEVGNKSLYTLDTLVGKTVAGHSSEGIFIASGKGIKKKGNLGTIDILQMAPTIYRIMGLKQPKKALKKPLNVF